MWETNNFTSKDLKETREENRFVDMDEFMKEDIEIWK